MPEPTTTGLDAILREWRRAILAAVAQRQQLRIVGGGSKDFYGRPPAGTPLRTRDYSGIVAYEPTELFIAARGGTPLAAIESALAEHGQMLACEPPHFGGGATLGGCVAAGLSGPRRARAGAVRDFVLGAKLLDGRGELLNFGGRVVKNVAGYDVSRLLAGSMGTLGLIAEVTLKVLPRPVAEITLRLDASQDDALLLANRWAAQPLPVSATCWHDGSLSVRLSGAAAAVAAARRQIGGTAVDDGDAYWRALRDQRTDFFAPAADAGRCLWRLSLPSPTAADALPAAPLLEWGGALRWLWGDAAAAADLRQRAERAGGHATLFRAGAVARQATSVFQPLPPPLAAIHRRLQRAFDPDRVFDGGRLYAEL